MKHIKLSAAAFIVGALAIGPAAAQAQKTDKPAASANAAQAQKWSTDSLVGDLLDNAQAKAVLIKHLPEIAEDDQIEMARGMTFRSLQQFSPEAITDALLAAIDADLAKLPPPAAPAAK